MRIALVAALVAAASTAPAQPMAGEGGAAQGQMPDPRMMSGQARPQEGDPPGRLTVRVVQGKFRVDEFGSRVADAPEGAVVHLIGYDAQQQASIESKPVDREGRAVFDGLATDGSRAYRAVAIVRRGELEDRLVSRDLQGQPGMITMPPQVGLRLMLAGEARDSAAPAVDDLTRDDELGTGVAPPAGEVVVRLRGRTDGGAAVRLLRVGAIGEVARGEAIVQKVRSRVRLQPAPAAADAALRDGMVQVRLSTREGHDDHGHDAGVPAARVEIRAAGAAPDAPPLTRVETGGDGVASLAKLPGGRLVARVTLFGVAVDSAPFERPAKGGAVVAVAASWTEENSLEARFTGVVADPAAVYYAIAEVGGRPYLTLPMQLTRGAGASASLLIYPELVVAFQGGGELDDQRMFFQLQLTLINPTHTPRQVGPEGLTIPLPRGFRGASVDEAQATRVKTVEQGLLWRGPVPPGQRGVVVSFSLEAQGGALDFDLPLPLGAWESQLVLSDIPGMRLQVPADARQRRVTGEGGKRYVVLGDINIEPGQRLTMRVEGLPRPSAAMEAATIGIGLGVIALLIWACVGIARARPATDPLAAERERLFAELVALERGTGKPGGGDGRRAQIVERLAAIAATEDRGAAGEPAP